MSAYDPEDAGSYPRSRPNLSAIAAEKVPVKPLFCYTKTPMWHLVDDIAKEAFAELIGELGDQVEEVEMPSLETVVAHHGVVQGAENAGYYGVIADRAGNAMSKGLRDRIEAGRKVTVERYIQALNAREALSRNIDNILMNYTAILTPASTGPAPKTLLRRGGSSCSRRWISRSRSRAFSWRIAVSLFCVCERSFWHCTRAPMSGSAHRLRHCGPGR